VKSINAGGFLAGLVLLPLLAFGLTGCGSGANTGIATAGGSGTPTTETGPSPAANVTDRLRQYAECLRQHGVQVPDPDQGKSVQLSQPNLPQAKAAAAACQQYAVSGAGDKAAQNVAHDRAYAQCMRQHGFPTFPDPDPNTGLTIPKSIVRSPNFAAADRVCSASVAKSGATSTP
jgi:hypothetical protein